MIWNLKQKSTKKTLKFEKCQIKRGISGDISRWSGIIKMVGIRPFKGDVPHNYCVLLCVHSQLVLGWVELWQSTLILTFDVMSMLLTISWCFRRFKGIVKVTETISPSYQMNMLSTSALALPMYTTYIKWCLLIQIINDD